MTYIPLCDLRKEETICSNCLKYNVPYAPPDALQTDRELTQSTLAKQKEKQKKKHQIRNLSPETRTLAEQKDKERKRKRQASSTDEERQSKSLARGRQRAYQTNEARKAARIANANQNE